MLLTVNGESIISANKIVLTNNDTVAIENVMPIPPILPLSLPIEGYDESDLNPALIIAIRDKKLSLHYASFLRVCSKHLVKTQPIRSKAMYAEYADMILKTYGKDNPCLADREGVGSVSHFKNINIL